MNALSQDRMQVSPRFADMAADIHSLCCLAESFKALADATRLHIIHLLMTHGEMCVCELMPALDLTQSNASFHLKTLKHAGFITSRKEGKWMHYSLNRKALEQFHTDFGGVFDVGKWQDNTAPASCDGTACRRAECR